MNFKVYSYLASGRPYIFIKPKYVFNCIRTKKILPLSPLYLTCLPNNNADYYKNNFDKFCDSYTSYLDLLELDEILATMKNDHPLNARLDHALSFQIRRRTKTSLCFGVDELSIIKLKMRGHCIVDSLE